MFWIITFIVVILLAFPVGLGYLYGQVRRKKIKEIKKASSLRDKTYNKVCKYYLAYTYNNGIHSWGLECPACQKGKSKPHRILYGAFISSAYCYKCKSFLVMTEDEKIVIAFSKEIHNINVVLPRITREINEGKFLPDKKKLKEK